MRFNFTLLFLLCCLLFGFNVPAVEPSVRFERLSIEDGLSQNLVDNIVQDNQGFMWFGTWDGLNRYDGYQFKHFRLDPQDKHSLSGNRVTALYVDTKHRLWVGTATGLNRYNHKNQRFVRFNHDETQLDSLSHDKVTAIDEDGKGRLWVGTDIGLNQYDPQLSTFKRFKHNPLNPKSLSDDKILAVFVDSKDRLWVGTDGGGLNRLDANSDTFVHFRHSPLNTNSLSHDIVSVIFEDDKGIIWVGTKAGLSQFDPKTESFVRFKQSALDNHSAHHEWIYTINQDTKGQIWLGTAEGLNRLNHQNQEFSRYKSQSSALKSLSDDYVLSLFKDSKGLIWIGTASSGVSKVNFKHQNFGHFNKNAAVAGSLSGNNVSVITQDSTGQTWVGTWSSGLNKMDSKSIGFKPFAHNSDTATLSMLEYPPGQLWSATTDGLNQYDLTSGRFTTFRHDENDKNSLSDDFLRTLYIDSTGALWIGTQHAGLNLFDEKNRRFKHYRHRLTDENSISNDYVRTIFEDTKGRLWVGTNNGLNVLNRANDQFTRYLHDEQKLNSISHNHIVQIQQDSTGTLWFATYGGGLNRYNEQTDDFSHYRVKEGLPNDTVYAILEDNAGFLWLSTNLGLSKFDPRNLTFKNFDVNDGLQSNEFGSSVRFKSKSGELFFGGVNGFNRFYPQNISDDTVPPKVAFTDFLLYNKSVAINPGASPKDPVFTLPKAIDALPKLTLGHQQALVTFEFAALDYASPGKNKYKYKLEGFDNDWIDADAQYRRATYTSLPSGDYTLRVKAANPDGYWNEQDTSIKIHVNPPPWLSWWAYLIYISLGIGFSLGVHRYRLQKNKLHNEHKMLNQMQQVDKLKDAFLANTSHELRTPLNGIIGLAESLIDGVAGPLPAKANKDLAMVVNSGKRLAHLINDILDLSKLKHRSIALNTQSVDLYSLVEVVMVLSKPLLAGKDIQLINAVPQDCSAVEADENRLLQIMHNLVGNGIKFTDQGTVRVCANETDNGVKVSVIDTGIGISEDKFSTIFDSFEQVEGDSNRNYGGTGLGLTITRQLVELHGGSIEVVSCQEQGSTFSVTLPVAGVKSAITTTLESVAAPEPFIVEKGVEKGVDEPIADSDFKVHENVDCAIDGSRFRLLLVDDDPINLQVLNNHLSMKNYQLVEAFDGIKALQAIDLAIERKTPFDMVLLDIMMPKLSGYEVCKKIRERYSVSELPVIFLTAKNRVEDLVQGFEVGGNDHLTKPVEKLEMLSRIAVHLQLLDINRNLDSLVVQRTEKLLLSEKLTTLGTLMAGVAHEINNPTNFAHLSAQNLKAQLNQFETFIFNLAGDDAEQVILDSFRQQFDPLYEIIATVLEGTSRIKTLIKDLKTSTHMKDTEKSVVDITDLLTSNVNLVSAKFKLQIEIVTDFKEVPLINCYPAKLNQVFMNLLVNACDAMDDSQGGKIEVGCDVRVDESTGEQLEITFKDNGCGMNDETKAKLFEPFFTTKQIDKGTGLGLSISYDIVQKHGGELRVESELGQGTVFRMILPV